MTVTVCRTNFRTSLFFMVLYTHTYIRLVPYEPPCHRYNHQSHHETPQTKERA